MYFFNNLLFIYLFEFFFWVPAMFIPPIDDAWDALWKSVTWGLFARGQAGQAPLQPSRCLAQQMWLDKPTEVHYLDLVSKSGFITSI